ncbi:MAG: response regulator transcription factor [Burkholderiaceae bacterium]|nr:response regulator transcription factor [Burkholderiaceae bacterium]MDH3460080.1 response regulator transcription factor [Burkholderiaceae bacterium]
MNEHLLLVEDEDAIADVMQLHLTEAGYSVQRESDGARAMRVIDAQQFDLVLLDLMLPGADGWDVCRHIRARRDHLPLMILSARSAEAHRVLGLELGADDYLPKPFSMLEMVARVRALLRRAEHSRNPPSSLPELRFDGLRLDPLRRELRRGETLVPLTLREFDLLYFLARHPGQAFSRAALLGHVWGSSFDGYEHTVNSHINRLRTKIETNPQDPHLIETVWGIGYRFGGGSQGGR